MEPENKLPDADLKKQLENFQQQFAGVNQAKISDRLGAITALASGPAKESLLSLLTEAANKGIMPKHALQLGDDTMEAVYSQGYNLYNQGRYKEASYIFRLLMLLDYMTPKYILGLAACLHRMKDFKNAANIYLLCGAIDAKNPLPHYHAADCYLQLEVPTLAIFSLGLAISAAGNQPQFAIVKERATLMREVLEKQLKEEASKLYEEQMAKKESAKKEKK